MTNEYLVRLAVAAAVGALLGAEREFRDKAAGFRTIMLICIGSCLFTIFSQELVTEERGDPTRMASAIVSGVGFLGAGVIFRRGRQSTGITTAATIWCAAALGVGLGGGRFTIALTAAVGILIVLWALPPVERVIDTMRESKTYEMRTTPGAKTIDEIHEMFDEHGLRVIDCSHGKRDGQTLSEIKALGRHQHHADMTNELLAADWVEQFHT